MLYFVFNVQHSDGSTLNSTTTAKLKDRLDIKIHLFFYKIEIVDIHHLSTGHETI